jgi:acyl carrier protein
VVGPALTVREREMRVRDRLRRFIQDSFLVDDLHDDESFLSSGIIDSLGVMQLVTFIESEYGIAVRDTELVPENFDSVDKLAAFVERKTQAA